jgi:hypothetical protein
MTSIAIYFGAALAVSGLVWSVADRLETVASKQSRRWLAELLSKANIEDLVKAWPQSVIHVFDFLFGKKHLSVKCFVRSSLVSIFIALSLVMMAVSTSPVWVEMLTDVLQKPVPPHITQMIVFWSVGSLLPDYLSLLQTRYVLNRMVVANTTRRIAGLVMLDFLATTLIARLSVIVVSAGLLASQMHMDVGYSFSRVFVDAWQLALSIVPRLTYFPGLYAYYDETSGYFGMTTGPWLYATYLTSVWVWLHLIALLLVRWAQPLDSVLGRMRWLFDYRKQPFRTIGGVLAVLILLLFAIAWPMLR